MWGIVSDLKMFNCLSSKKLNYTKFQKRFASSQVAQLGEWNRNLLPCWSILERIWWIGVEGESQVPSAQFLAIAFKLSRSGHGYLLPVEAISKHPIDSQRCWFGFASPRFGHWWFHQMPWFQRQVELAFHGQYPKTIYSKDVLAYVARCKERQSLHPIYAVH